MKKEEASYWIALAHLPRWGFQKINNLLIQFCHNHKIGIDDFFHLEESVWKKEYGLDEKQIADLKQAKSELPGNAFLAESLFDQGYEILPITSPEYSKTMKINLKVANAPAVLYIKGNKKILEERSIAIVGSRDASERALQFTDQVAKLASQEFKAVVSGFARGVDKQALDSAIAHKGQSIIVLPQGIMTFGSGFKTYYKPIQEGNVLVVSTFAPKAPWKPELAMARNPIIYGLAEEIFVAESADKGGTWSGVVDGLRKGRKIFVRLPDPKEKNANLLLLEKGAIPVDSQGKELLLDDNAALVSKAAAQQGLPSELELRQVLDNCGRTAKELLEKLALSCSAQKLDGHLKKLDFISISKEKGVNLYKIKSSAPSKQTSLFE